jgi:CRP/FNR family transcriptional regulator
VSKITADLQKFQWFKSLTDEELSHIEEITNQVTLDKNKHIFYEGDPIEAFYFINFGRVRAYKTDPNGKEQIVSVLKDGEMFPHIGIFSNKNYPASTQTVDENVVLYKINVQVFRDMLLRYPTISLKLIGTLEMKIADLQNRLAEQIFNNTFEKLTQQLNRLAKEHGVELDGWTIIDIPLTNTDLANMIGTTRESVNRSLAKLKSKGVIDSTPDGFMKVKLEEIVE